MKHMKYMPVWLRTVLLFFVLFGCGKGNEESHIEQLADEILAADKEGKDAVASFSLTTESTMPINDIHIYGFATSGEIKMHLYYPTSAILSDAMIAIDAMDYIFVALVNVGEDFRPPSPNSSAEELPNITLSNFTKWLEEIKPDYEYLLSGMKTATIEKNGFTRVDINIKERTDGLAFSSLRLTLTMPDGELPEMTKSAGLGSSYSSDGYALRATVEVYLKGSDVCLLNYSKVLSEPTFDLPLLAGDYDLLLWADYVPVGGSKSHRTDHYYNTTELQQVRFSETTPYAANTDGRDVSSQAFEASVTGGSSATEKVITLSRSVAKYRIISTDVEQFLRFNSGVALGDLKVSVIYEGYIPNKFNVKSNTAVGSAQGLAYGSVLFGITTSEATLGSDYLFMNGDELSTPVTITVTNEAGKEISKVTGVQIDMRRGYLTTIRGEFLTAGGSSAGITINTEWDDEEIVHPF